MKTFSVIVCDTLEALENYAESTNQIYPDDIGYAAIKKYTIKCLQNDGSPNPGPGLVDPVVEAVERELTAIQFERSLGVINND